LDAEPAASKRNDRPAPTEVPTQTVPTAAAVMPTITPAPASNDDAEELYHLYKRRRGGGGSYGGERKTLPPKPIIGIVGSVWAGIVLCLLIL
jgi:hypothetical protein